MSTAAGATAPPLSPEVRRLALVVVAGAIMTILDTTIVNVAVSTLGRDFHTSLSTIQWVITGYTLALSMTIPITGWAVERFGGKRMWIASLGLFIVGSVLCGAAWSVPSLIAFRVLQGIGGGMIMPVGQTMLARAAGPERMGRVMSVIAVPAMIAPVLGPIVGGLIVGHLSWRWLFYVNVPFCAAAVVLAVRLLPADTASDSVRRLDLGGLLLLSPGLAGLVYGLSEAGNGAGGTDPRLLGGAVGGALLVAWFVRHALRSDRPLLDLRVFRDRAFASASGGLLLYCAALFGLMLLLPLYFQLVRHGSPLDAGLMLAPLGLGAVVTMPLSGRLTDARGGRGVALAGLPLVVAGMAVYTQVGAGTSYLLLAAAVFVIGLGHGLMMPALMSATYQGLPRSVVPSATTTGNIVIRVGGAFGSAVLAVLLQAAIRSEVPGAGGSLAAAGANRGAGAAGLLAGAFGDTVWWAVALTAAVVVPVLLIPRRPAPAAAPAAADPARSVAVG